MITFIVALTAVLNVAGALAIAAYYQYNSLMLLGLQFFTALVYFLLNKISKEEAARKIPVWLCFILPGVGPLVFGLGYVIEHIMVTNTSLIADYEKYIGYVNDRIGYEMPDVDKEINVMSIYDSIKYSENDVKKQVIAELIVGEAEYRVDVLKKALSDPDPEVVHYAAAALNHIEQRFEEALFTLGNQYQRDKKYEILKELLLVMKQQIASGLLEGTLLKLTMRDYADFLREALDHQEEFDTLLELLETLLKLGQYNEAFSVTRKMYQDFPERHESHFALMRNMYYLKNYREVTSIARRILKLDLALTDDERAVINFWV